MYVHEPFNLNARGNKSVDAKCRWKITTHPSPHSSDYILSYRTPPLFENCRNYRVCLAITLVRRVSQICVSPLSRTTTTTNHRNPVKKYHLLGRKTVINYFDGRHLTTYEYFAITWKITPDRIKTRPFSISLR